MTILNHDYFYPFFYPSVFLCMRILILFFPLWLSFGNCVNLSWDVSVETCFILRRILIYIAFKFKICNPYWMYIYCSSLRNKSIKSIFSMRTLKHSPGAEPLRCSKLILKKKNAIFRKCPLMGEDLAHI